MREDCERRFKGKDLRNIFFSFLIVLNSSKILSEEFSLEVLKGRLLQIGEKYYYFCKIINHRRTVIY